ncbi:hypothetical protein KRR38_08550 [Novosphingobium sp. G106]|uniref:hypothetical protein n=1 Tax=Novosphingobium sp. G106 TaxID=2849500 RepID=UPI001C2DC53D|nr:hypothetical protein [Novosphingobium sp. G106]MBV1687723.1 hypothetical protein [Novosphingobium sp. G106]
MATRPSRAYKLKLSRAGIILFIECHGRLCRLAADLLPYGMTLRTAVTMLEAVSLDELAAELASRELAGFAGGEIRFVGTSPSLAVFTAQLAAQVAELDVVPAQPQTWRIFLAGLSLMREAGDTQLLRAYNKLRQDDQEGRPEHVAS